MLRGARAPGTSLEVVSKDVALAVALARTLGEDASVARAAWEMYERAVDQGLDGWGLASLVDVEPGSDPT
jgi:3-hydroxyisobutyrate dehydrogenase-like beta-hydroxyacid dehydrogenase